MKPSAQGITDADWNSLVGAAKGEVSLSIATYSGSAYRPIMAAFEAAYTGIKVELGQFQSSSRDFVPRFLQERKANVFAWDVAVMPSTEMLRQVRPVGGVDPIRPALLRGDILDDASWRGGFEDGFLDLEKKWCYAPTQNRNPAFWYNADQVKEGEIKSVKDLLDPKWKGKLLGNDPRTKGGGFNPATAMRLRSGDDSIIEKLYKGQEVVLSDDARQLVEFMVRGRYPIEIGPLSETLLADFQAQGLGNNIKSALVNDMDYVNTSSNVVWLVNQAPHPNAAKVFINWLLSKDAQTLWSKQVKVNSRRADVLVYNELLVAPPEARLIKVDGEELIDELRKTQEIAKKALG